MRQASIAAIAAVVIVVTLFLFYLLESTTYQTVPTVIVDPPSEIPRAPVGEKAEVGSKRSTPNADDASTALERMVRQNEASLSESATKKQREEASQSFKAGFFLGFVDPISGSCGGTIHCARGAYAGRMYRKDYPESVDSIMKAYGYTYVELDGRYSSGFEHSGFTPVKPYESGLATFKDAKEAAKVAMIAKARFATPGGWWRKRIGSVDSSIANSSFGPCDVWHVKGYLSPLGEYGHLGSYSRELLMREASCASAVQPRPSTDPLPPKPGNP
jgi:hypothetical protein